MKKNKSVLTESPRSKDDTMANAPEKMFFCMADISGYTKYMVSSQETLHHAMVIITNLLEAIIKEAKLPFKISKIEGDAVLMYIRERDIPKSQSEPLALGKKLLSFFDAFYCKLEELKSSRICECDVCKNIQTLNIKIICHYGEAVIQKIGNFEELSGVDVILVHRLLKNSLTEKRYLLLTEQAFKKILLPDDTITKGEEYDKDLGKIPIYVYHPKPVDVDVAHRKLKKFLNFFPIYLWPIFLFFKGKKKDQFKNF